MRVLKQADPEGKYGAEYDLSSLRQIWFAGEHLDLNTKVWTEQYFGVPVINHWWQTETGSVISGTCVGLKNPCSDTELTTGLPFPGYNGKVGGIGGLFLDTKKYLTINFVMVVSIG